MMQLFVDCSIVTPKGPLPLRKISMGSDRNKIEPTHGLSVPIFCSSLNLDDKELRYFQLLWSGGVDNTRWKKVQSDPIRCLFF